MKRRTFAAIFMTTAVLVGAGRSDAQSGSRGSPVTASHLSRITGLLRGNGIVAGSAILDRQGRVELAGEFDNEAQVDRAFSLAQTVVGVRWVSPVTPESIKVKQWEDCLGRIMSGEQCGPGAPVSPAPPGPIDEAAPGPVANKYALIVGVGQFKNRIQPLQYAGKDAYDIYSYLVDPGGGNFNRENVILLRDQHATRDHVVRALQEIKQRAQADDLVLIYLSSHGTPPDKYGGVHVVTYDSEAIPRERIWQTALTESILRDFIQTQKAKRLIVIMDACYSNGAYTNIAGFLPQGGKSLDAGADEGYGRSRRHMAERLLGAKDLLVGGGPERPGPLPEEFPRGWGKVLMSASDAGERSWESDQVRNSIFTYHFILGLRTNRGALKGAFEYAKPLVRQQVKREKGSDIEQNPQITPARRDWNMSVAVAGR